MKILIVGGAGYVGSAVSAFLLDQGHDVWVLDDLSRGHEELILCTREKFLQSRCGNYDVVFPFLQKNKFDGVMHFAAFAQVGESVSYPELYFENNVTQTKALLDAMIDAGIRNFIFSSTCAIFGNPGDQRISETLPKNPMNPYGETKLQCEKVLEDYAKKKGLKSVALRYFNASGAEPKSRVGEWHYPESHLIPNLFRAIQRNEKANIFGNQYPTRDGTCVRDYVHVSDLAYAHLEALKLIHKKAEGCFEFYNLGSEDGYSVLEVLETVQKITGKKINYQIQDARAGDPPELVADSTKAKKANLLPKQIKRLDEIISSAWKWFHHKNTIHKAVFLDRDGTLNIDPGYLNDPEKLVLFPKTAEALKKLKSNGYKLIVASNQSGVGRGIVQKENLVKIEEKLQSLLQIEGVEIDDFFYCFCTPDDPNCQCRKPSPHMLLEASDKHAIDLSKSYMIGDRKKDIDAGVHAGCKGSFLVLTGLGEEEKKEIPPQDVFKDLLAASEKIITQG